MRGLAFPTNAHSDRETSYEDGTTATNVDDIPIDPALGGGPLEQLLDVVNDEEVYLQVRTRFVFIQTR